MDVGEWEWLCLREAEDASDEQRLEMMACLRRGFVYREPDPDRALEWYARGRELARRLRDRWWEAYYEVWVIIARAHYKKEYHHLLDDAVRLSLRVRRPEFAGFPPRFMAFNCLINVYLHTDPVGHAASMQESLAYLDGEIPPGPGADRHIMLEMKALFLRELGRLDESVAASLEELALIHSGAEDWGWYDVAAHSNLCWFHACRRDWDSLAEYVGPFEEAARRVPGRQIDLGEAALWRGVLARRAGDGQAAARLYRQAVARVGRLKQIPPRMYHDAVAIYHESGGDFQAALAARGEELARVRDRGMLAHECDLAIERCRLLSLLGRLADADVVAARESAARLRQPEAYLARLERAVAGEG